MRLLPRGLAAVLSAAIAAQPVLAAQAENPAASATRAATSAPIPKLPALPALASSLQAPDLAQTAALTTPSAGVAPARVAQAADAAVARRLQTASAQAARAVENLPSAGVDGARSASRRQFDALTGEQDSPRTPSDEVSAQAPDKSPPLPAPGGGQGVRQPAPPKPPKNGLFRVFNDPKRNRDFWMYLTGSMIFLFGYELYLVGMPFLVSSITNNSLREHHDPRAGNEAAVNALIRSNRSITRIAHYSAQAVSYALTPLLTRKDSEEPQPWLSRSMLLRAAMLSAVSVIFFMTGFVTLGASIGFLALAMAGASFFQGVTVTRENVGTTRILGDPSVTEAEQTKANAILSFAASLNSIIAPALAGHLATIRDFFHKSGSGGAVIYALYSGLTAMAGLVWRGVAIFKEKRARASSDPAAPSTGPPGGLWPTLKELGRSLRDGTKLFYRNKFLRAIVLVTLVNDMFSDPLSFNVLPEYAEKIITSHPALGHLLHVPVLGWFLSGLTSTPMGYFSFMVVVSSFGAILGAMLIKPARKLLERLGYRTNQSMLKPFYILALLEAPLFWLMLRSHSMLGILALYGLQALVTDFGALTASGVQQKELDNYSTSDLNKLSAAESFIGVVVAIISTIAYGFVLRGISLHASMIIAGAAIAVQAIMRFLVPWMAFTKEQRKRQPPPPPEAS